MYTYHCYNTKHIHIPLSQYKTGTLPLSIQNMYTYHCHNTKHVHIPLSIQNRYTYHCQYKTCTHTTVTIQNIYTYHCQYKTGTCTTVNRKHVHIPPSQYWTCTHTTVTIQNMYTYHCHSTKHVNIPLGTANINVYSQVSCLIGSFAFKSATQQNTKYLANLKFRSCYFPNLTPSDDRRKSLFIF